MSMIAQQSEFLMNFAKLILHAQGLGYEVTAGELWRPPEMQEIYLKTGRSRVAYSRHQDRLAGDLNFFRDGALVTKREDLKPLGDYWESLGPEYRWGGSWRGAVEAGTGHFIDCPHFERKLT